MRSRLGGLGATAVVLLAAVRIAGVGAERSDPADRIDRSRYMAHVKYLASDELKGRGNGTPELRRAGQYVADRFREAGLVPGGEDGSFFQPFAAGDKIIGAPSGSIRFETPDGRQIELVLGRDYVPASVGPTPPEAPLPIVFAGYGIVTPSLDYDDYAGLDVRGKAVVVFTHEPGEHDPDSPFEGTEMTQHGSVFEKGLVARMRGAALVLLMTDPSHRSDDLDLASWAGNHETELDGITVLRVSRERLGRVFGRALDFDRLARRIDAAMRPASQAVPGFAVRNLDRIQFATFPLRNVIGVMKGSDPRHRDEVILVGAHYDHLGMGERHSLAPGRHEVHNGADDNASGTAAVLEIARAAAGAPERFGRSIVFAAFAGEEMGLLGSSYFVEHPTVALDRVAAMLNLDMIGRPHGRLLVGGLDVSPVLERDLDAAHQGSPLAIELFKEADAMGSSDDAPFILRGIPSLSFFSGFHGDYHRPTDDWQKIDVPGAVETTRLAMRVLERLASPEASVTASGGQGGRGR